MNLKESLSSYVIFHGPPFVGKSSYFTSELSKTYKRISPRELFQKSSTLSLRQLINNYIIKPLLKGEKVVVDDSMQTMGVRRSYTSTVLDKIPNIQCTCLALHPEFGKMQLSWKREILLAEAVLNEEWHSLEKIFTNDIDVWYAKCEPVLDVEELRKFEVPLPLQIHSRHLFEIPCLMIECKGGLDAKVVGLMENWSRQNKSGRIIAIYESDRNTRNEEVQKSVLEFQKSVQLMSDLVVCAYLVDVGSHGDLTSFTTSVLAFLMRLHCLDLFSSNSVYLYESLKHRKMVESVGMRHMKLARALTNPDLLRHGTTQFPVPKMLQSMRVVLPPGEAKERTADAPCVPLLQAAIESDSCIAKVAVGNHRTIFIAAKNADTLRRYQKCLLEDPDPPTDIVDRSPPRPKSTIGQKRRLPSSNFKVLPSWMISKRRKTLDQSARSVDGVGRMKTERRQSEVLPSTVYIMTEQELLKTAATILREGGKIDQQDCLGASEIKSFVGRKKLVKKEKPDVAEESILDEVLEEKSTRLRLESGTCDKRDKVCMDFNHESDAREDRLSNIRSQQQVKHQSTSKHSPRTPQFKSPIFHSSSRLAKSSCTKNSTRNEVISSDDTTTNDVGQVFVDRVPDSRCRVSSKSGRTAVSLSKSAHTKESPDDIYNSSRQVVNSSNCPENMTRVRETNFLDEILTGGASTVRQKLKYPDVPTTDLGSPLDKKVLKKSDSDISHFIDSLMR